MTKRAKEVSLSAKLPAKVHVNLILEHYSNTNCEPQIINIIYKRWIQLKFFCEHMYRQQVTNQHNLQTLESLESIHIWCRWFFSHFSLNNQINTKRGKRQAHVHMRYTRSKEKSKKSTKVKPNSAEKKFNRDKLQFCEILLLILLIILPNAPSHCIKDTTYTFTSSCHHL